MCIGDLTDGLDSILDPLRGGQGTDHQDNQTISGKAKFLALGLTGLKADAIHAVRYHSATPARHVPFVEIRIGADEAFAPEKAILAAVRVRWPIAILRYKDVG